MSQNIFQPREMPQGWSTSPHVIVVPQPAKHMKVGPSCDVQTGVPWQVIVQDLPTTVQVVPLIWATSRHDRSD